MAKHKLKFYRGIIMSVLDVILEIISFDLANQLSQQYYERLVLGVCDLPLLSQDYFVRKLT